MIIELRSRNVVVDVALLAVPTALVLLVAVFAMRIHRPTNVDLKLTVTSVSFTSADQRPERIVGATPFSSLAVHGVAQAKLDARRAVPRSQGEGASTAAWMRHQGRLLPVVRISQAQPDGAAVIIQPSGKGTRPLGELNRVSLAPGARADISVATEGPHALSIHLFEAAVPILWSLLSEVTMEVINARVDVPMPGTPENGSTLAIRLPPTEPGSFVELVGTTAGVTVVLAPTSEPVLSLETSLRVSTIDFVAHSSSGTPTSTIIASDGRIKFPTLQNQPDIWVEAGDNVVLAGLEDFVIRKLEFRPDRREIYIEAGGVLGSLRYGHAGNTHERTVTWFDSIWLQSRPMQLFTLAVWLIPTLWSARKLIKELQS